MRRNAKKLRVEKEQARAAERRAAAQLEAELRQLVQEFGLIPVLAELSKKYCVNKGAPLEKNVRAVAGNVIAEKVSGKVSMVGLGASISRG